MPTEEAGKPTTDRDCMLRAIELARLSISEADKISPKVGAVVIRDGVILGEAFRGELHAGDHAEFTLLEKKLGDATLAGATLFTTLEPCTSRHDPKIPCADRIIERHIGKVFIGVIDPNKLIQGEGELRLRAAGIQIARFDSDLMPVIEELNREFSRYHRPAGKPRQRTDAETHDPVEPGEVGPNGYRIGYTPEGDKVEWVQGEDEPGNEWPLLLRRNDKAILAMYNELWDKVWWNRHQVLMAMEAEDAPKRKDRKALIATAKKAAKRIEDKYGLENLELDGFEYGLLSGRMSALSWVMGSEWDESLDT